MNFQPPDPVCRFCEDWCSGTCEGAREAMLAPEFKRAGATVIDRYRMALESIAKNTCCACCREAAQVAQAALNAAYEEGFKDGEQHFSNLYGA